MIDIIGSIVVIIIGMAVVPIFICAPFGIVACAIESFSKARLNRVKTRYFLGVCDSYYGCKKEDLYL